MIIEISALDTLFFRDGKPFTMGENHWTDSIFPPNMSTIYGAIRTAYFSENMEVFQQLRENKELNTDKDPTKKLVIKRMLYRINNEGYYYNMPLDLVRLKDIPSKDLKAEKENKKYEVYPLKIKENKYINSLPLKYILYFDEHVKTVPDGLLEEHRMDDYINGRLDDISICSLFDYLCDEPKVGIGVDRKTGASKDSRLYRIDLKRLKNLSLIVEVEGIELKNKGLMKFGGEGKYAKYKEVSEWSYPLELVASKEINKRFKLSLMTPAIFEKGWLPKGIGEDEYILENHKFKLKLVAAIIGKNTLIGGYDMAKNRPKPMLKAVPAGSTYYFEILEGKPKDIIEHFHLKSISDRMAKEGYGLSFISKWGDWHV